MLSTINPQLTVVTVNYYSEQFLERCIASVAASPDAVECIVVDNGSDDAHRERICARYPEVLWIRLARNVGFGAASNIGAQRAKSELLLFLNPDSWIVDGTLSRLIEALNGTYRDCIIGCAVLNLDGSLQSSCRRFPEWKAALGNSNSLIARLFPDNPFTRSYLMADFDHQTPREVDWASGAAIALRSDLFTRLQGFDTSFFMYCEDVDLCKRAAEIGVKTWFHPLLTVMHAIGGSSRAYPVRSLHHRHVSLWLYYQRHLRIRLLDPAVFLFLSCRFLMSALAIVLRVSRRTAETA